MVNDFYYDPDKFITFEEVKKLWKTNKKPVVAYLNNPFCQGKNGKNCKFCVHRGITQQKQEDVHNFYFDYMPKMFKKYEEIINEQDIKMVAFGGGTPNYLSAKEFDKYLNLLPEKLKPLPKQIELHTAWLTKDFLDVLAKHNFRIVTFCIQTFDKDTLDKWNRLPAKEETLELMEYAHKLGMTIAVDFITYWTTSDKDFDILYDDLYKIKNIRPEEITISVLYQNKTGDLDEIYSKLRRAFYMVFPDYENLDGSDKENPGINATRFYSPNSDETRKLYGWYIDSLTAVHWETERTVSTLGIGCYKNQVHDVYSTIGGIKTIYEIYDGDGEERYYLAKDINFWDEVEKIVKKLRNVIGEEIPIGTILTLQNINYTTEFVFGNYQQGDLRWNISSQDEEFINRVREKITPDEPSHDFSLLHET